MQPNEKIICPACGEASMAKLKPQMDGFKKVGEELVCMLCGAHLCAWTAEEANAQTGENHKLNDLSLLLGAVPVATARLAAAENEKCFCKDCAHFLKHPFVDRCDLDNRPVDPMDDCEKYQKRA